MHTLLHIKMFLDLDLQGAYDVCIRGCLVPDWYGVPAVFEWKDDSKYLAKRHVKLVSNHCEEQILPELGRVRLRCPNGPPASINAGRILPQGLNSIDKLKKKELVYRDKKFDLRSEGMCRVAWQKGVWSASKLAKIRRLFQI